MKVLQTGLEIASRLPNTGAMTKNVKRAAEHTARRTAPGRGADPIHRHRQARLRLAERPLTGPGRFDHLKRVYD